MGNKSKQLKKMKRKFEEAKDKDTIVLSDEKDIPVEKETPETEIEEEEATIKDEPHDESETKKSAIKIAVKLHKSKHTQKKQKSLHDAVSDGKIILAETPVKEELPKKEIVKSEPTPIIEEIKELEEIKIDQHRIIYAPQTIIAPVKIKQEVGIVKNDPPPVNSIEKPIRPEECIIYFNNENLADSMMKLQLNIEAYRKCEK